MSQHVVKGERWNDRLGIPNRAGCRVWEMRLACLPVKTRGGAAQRGGIERFKGNSRANDIQRPALSSDRRAEVVIDALN